MEEVMPWEVIEELETDPEIGKLIWPTIPHDNLVNSVLFGVYLFEKWTTNAPLMYAKYTERTGKIIQF